MEEYLPYERDVFVCRNEAIKVYFNLGFAYLEIIAFLSEFHNFKIGLRQLNRILRSLGLRRHKTLTNMNQVFDAIKRELSGVGRNLGYRAMQARLRHVHGLHVDRESVRLILCNLDPIGVQARRQRKLVRRKYMSKGPNYIIHIDGWDKLRSFGLTIHGAIDGFSRRILWLEGSRSNKNPFQICYYFCKLLKKQNGVPHIVRADRGTENVNVQMVQEILRRNNDDDRGRLRGAFLYGRSTANQRIESWWSKFRNMGMEIWIKHFKDLERYRIIDTSNNLHLQLVRYCYMPLLCTELRRIQVLWNTHHLRPIISASVPDGKPDVMYHFPEIYDTVSYLHHVDQHLLETLTEIAAEDLPDCTDSHRQLFDNVSNELDIGSLPTCLKEAASMFTTMLDFIECELTEVTP